MQLDVKLYTVTIRDADGNERIVQTVRPIEEIAGLIDESEKDAVEDLVFRLCEQLRAGGIDAVVKTGVNPVTEPQPVPLCAVHQVPMKWRETAKGNFWSCNQKTAGKWCTYRP